MHLNETNTHIFSRWCTALLKSFWITGLQIAPHARFAMLRLVFTGTAGSSVRVIFNYSNRAREPSFPVLLYTPFFVLYLLVHHLMLPFVYDDQNRNWSTARVYIFWPDQNKEGNFFEFTNLFPLFSLFHKSVFFMLFIVKILFLLCV